MVLEATYGWYWAADVLQDLGAHVHLAHALGNNWGNRRVKNDVRDAQDLPACERQRLRCSARSPSGPRQLAAEDVELRDRPGHVDIAELSRERERQEIQRRVRRCGQLGEGGHLGHSLIVSRRSGAVG